LFGRISLYQALVLFAGNPIAFAIAYMRLVVDSAPRKLATRFFSLIGEHRVIPTFSENSGKSSSEKKRAVVTEEYFKKLTFDVISESTIVTSKV
jgi:hypothetical protein